MASLVDQILNSKRVNSLKNLACSDYEAARGTAHLKLLKNAEKRLTHQIDDHNKRLSTTQNELAQIQKKTNDQMLEALEKYIVNQHLTEVPGIGPKLSHTIIQYVFRGRLQDLRKASYTVHGIGQNKQYLIDMWIKQWEQKIPSLLKEYFPGKSEILTRAETQKKGSEEAIVNIEREKRQLIERLTKARDVIKCLEEVKLQDFVNALLTPDKTNPRIDDYQRGVFAEWEPIPDWFKELITESES
jgi:hypothetical protein